MYLVILDSIFKGHELRIPYHTRNVPGIYEPAGNGFEHNGKSQTLIRTRYTGYWNLRYPNHVLSGTKNMVTRQTK